MSRLYVLTFAMPSKTVSDCTSKQEPCHQRLRFIHKLLSEAQKEGLRCWLAGVAYSRLFHPSNHQKTLKKKTDQLSRSFEDRAKGRLLACGATLDGEVSACVVGSGGARRVRRVSGRWKLHSSDCSSSRYWYHWSGSLEDPQGPGRIIRSYKMRRFLGIFVVQCLWL